MTTAPLFSLLSDELLTNIFLHLPSQDLLVRVRFVNRHFHSLVHSKSLWIPKAAKAWQAAALDLERNLHRPSSIHTHTGDSPQASAHPNNVHLHAIHTNNTSNLATITNTQERSLQDIKGVQCVASPSQRNIYFPWGKVECSFNSLFRKGNSMDEIRAAEKKLGLEFPVDVKAALMICSGANIPSFNKSTHAALTCLNPVDQWWWFDPIAQPMVLACESHLVVGMNPDSGNAGCLVLLSTETWLIEQIVLSIPLRFVKGRILEYIAEGYQDFDLMAAMRAVLFENGNNLDEALNNYANSHIWSMRLHRFYDAQKEAFLQNLQDWKHDCVQRVLRAN